MTIPPFHLQAAAPCPVYDEFALALTAEFRPMDAGFVLAQLDDLGRELGERCCGQPLRDALACRDLLDGAVGLRPCTRINPRHLMLDTALERATGHPLILAVLYAEVGRRAGVALRPVAAGQGRYLVAHADRDRSLVLDPQARGRVLGPGELPDGLRWLCAHEVGFAILGELVDAYALAGDLTRACHAAELRLSLPLDEGIREQVRLELRGLEARLN